MVDLADCRRASSHPVDWISDRHVHASGMAVVVVGARAGYEYNLVVCPDSLVLGLGGYQVIRLAPRSGDPLADAMGAAVAKTSEWLST